MSENEVSSLEEKLQKLPLEGGSQVEQGQVAEEEAAPKQQPRRGKKGKKQKWTKVDLSTVPGAFSSNSESRQESSQASRGGGGAWSQHNRHERGSGGNYGGRGYSGGWNNQNSAPAYDRQRTVKREIGLPREDFARMAADVPKSREDTVALSKALVRLLRHGNPSDIMIDDEGYAIIDHIVSHPAFRRFHTSGREIEKLVAENDKKRYEIQYDSDNKPLKIKATQGHSIKFKNMELLPITDPHKYPHVVHGTYASNWRKIKREGLNRFQRTHIHFAIGLIGETHVTSGMRATCDIVIHLDMEKAIKDGLKFYESSNQVVLAEGDKDGIISPRYFKKVTKYDPKDGSFKSIDFQFQG